MTRIFTEGFENGSSAEFFAPSTGGGAGTSPVRSGTYNFELFNTSIDKLLPSSYSEFYLRIGYNALNAHSNAIIRWRKGTTELGSIRFNSTTKKVEIYTGSSTLVSTGTLAILPNIWVLIEVHVKIADAGGVIQVKLDGISDASYTGDTKPGADTDVNSLLFDANGSRIYYDDLALNDVSGSVDNSWCGDGKIVAMMPNANGDSSQLINSNTGTTNNYTYVDERPSNSDTDYVQGTIVDQRDLYNLSSPGIASGTIQRVWIESRSRDTVAAGGLISLVLKTNSVEYQSNDLSLLTSYQRLLGPEYLYNPGTSGTAWSIPDLEALQAGPKTRS